MKKKLPPFAGPVKPITPPNYPIPKPQVVRPSEAEIMAKQTPAGGWTKKQLAEWGVSWPPPKGWKEALIGKSTLPHPLKCSKCDYIATTAADSRQHWFDEH